MHACVSGHLDLVNLLLQNREGQHPDLAFTPLDVNHADAGGSVPQFADFLFWGTTVDWDYQVITVHCLTNNSGYTYCSRTT